MKNQRKMKLRPLRCAGVVSRFQAPRRSSGVEALIVDRATHESSDVPRNGIKEVTPAANAYGDKTIVARYEASIHPARSNSDSRAALLSNLVRLPTAC